MLENQIFPSAQWRIVRRYAPRTTYTKTGAVVQMIFMVYNLERDLEIDPTRIDHYVTDIPNDDGTTTRRFLGFSKKHDLLIRVIH